MTNRTLTALIVRLAGFALFIKIFDFFGSYFLSIYLTAQLAFMDETSRMVDSFDKLYISGTILSFTNLLLSIVLIFKADWIASKIAKSESEIKIDLTTKSVMRIVIATIGIIYCAKTLYTIPTNISDVYLLINNWNIPGHGYEYLPGITNYVFRAIIGVVFVFKAERISKLLLGKKGSL